MFNNINCVFFSIARPPPEKDIEIAKEVIPNLDELLKDEKNARELVFQLNDAMIETTLIYLKRDNKYLMLHRTKKENDINENKWLGIGGKLELNETPDECIKREVKEETGLALISYKSRGYIMFYNTKCETEKIHLFESDDFSGDIIECSEGDLSWVSIDKVMDLNLWEGDRIFLKELINTTNEIKMEFHYDGDKLIDYKKI